MASDKSKHLIPCYKGIDAYDMPKEFAKLQAQDMGKVGAMQDLLRGIEKILPKQKNTTVIQEKVVVGGSGNNKIASLLDRGNMALEDGDWAKADSFFEDVLNNDSKNAQAYLGKTLAMERCRTIDAFARKRKDASQNVRGEKLELQPNHSHIDEMVKQFSLPGYVEQSEIRKLYDCDLSYHSDVAERRQQYRNEEKYWADHKQLSRAEKFATGAVAENLQREKKALFAALSDRVKKAEEAEAAAKKNVQERYETHLRQADEKAERLYNEGISHREEYYQELLKIAKTSSDIKELTETAKKFENLGDFQDSKNLAVHCQKRVTEEQAKLEAEKERKAEIARKEAAEKAKRNKAIAIIAAMAACVIIAVVAVMVEVVIPSQNYAKAESLLKNKQYEEAYHLFVNLGNYRNAQEYSIQAKEKKIEADYSMAHGLIENGEYESAIAYYKKMCDFTGSEDPMTVCFDLLVKQSESVDFDLALDILGCITEDYYQLHPEACLEYAERLLENSSWTEAEKYAQMCLSQHENTDKTALQYLNYAQGMRLMEKEKYDDAIERFSAIEDASFRDTAKQTGLSYYFVVMEAEKLPLADAIAYLEKSISYLADTDILADAQSKLSEYAELAKCEGKFKCYKKVKEGGILTIKDINYRLEMSFYVDKGQCFLVFNNSLFHDTKVNDAIVKPGEDGYAYKTVHSDSDNSRIPEQMWFSQDEVVFTGGPFTTVYYYQRTE